MTVAEEIIAQKWSSK